MQGSFKDFHHGPVACPTGRSLALDNIPKRRKEQRRIFHGKRVVSSSMTQARLELKYG